MKLTAVIAEYNPFHKGHAYHLHEAQQLGSPILAVQTGAFVQRGECALFDKYDRAYTALKNGANAVFELPPPFAFAPADKFTLGAFKVLQNIDAEITLSFGSESGDIEAIERTADLLLREPVEFRERLKINLENGLNFNKSRFEALNDYAKENYIEICDISAPNNILAIEYAKLNQSLGYPFKLHTIKRIGNYKGNNETVRLRNEYNQITDNNKDGKSFLSIYKIQCNNEKYATDNGASKSKDNQIDEENEFFKTLSNENERLVNFADENKVASSSIVNALYNQNENADGFLSASEIRNYFISKKEIPEQAVSKETARLFNTRSYVNNDIIFLFQVLNEGKEKIANIFDVKEGLENRIYNEALSSTTTLELIQKVVNARYSESRIRRILTSILLGVTKEKFDKAIEEPIVMNLLAGEKKAKDILSLVKGKLITSQNGLQYLDSEQARLMYSSQLLFKLIRGYANYRAFFE